MSKSRRRTRDASPIASHAALGDKYPHFKNPYNLTPAAVQFREATGLDRRRFRPDKSTRPPTFNRSQFARVALQIVKVRQKKRVFHGKLQKYNPEYHFKSHLRKRLGFSVPRRIEACIRRWTRKEVLFAKRKTGKSGQKKPHFNFWSALSCRKR